ncbi:hypothetical protein CR194_05035 [Salipaludibacillus keqinensis]|uniref:Uncharacterized protein n=1 Tax=Salipaludibacillus keqinensis TaxID=2045207 RepID=A0A323TJY7_9BACI|nr:hypothetical protein [Salipaludibacillus keqinensis]PYZ94890.1 hypothetical protein CR194_05035 [Salipaludibacillus keqinensis]
MMEMYSLVGGIIFLIPLIIAILLIKWLFNIKQNSDEQIRQNKEIISMLRAKENRETSEK